MIDDNHEIDGLDAESRALARELVREGMEWKPGMRKFVHTGLNLESWRLCSLEPSSALLSQAYECQVPHALDNKGEPDKYPDLNDAATIGVIEGMVWDYEPVLAVDLDRHDAYDNGPWHGVVVASVTETQHKIIAKAEGPTRGVVIAKLWLAVMKLRREEK